MNKKSITKEERYLIASYEAVKNSENPLEVELDRHQIAKIANITDKCANAIVKQHIRANFFIKRGEFYFSCTDYGIKIAKSLLDSE
ncbi:hypothetical protein N9Y92_03315 [Chlamydiales bacterium]|nr:hypothetical protein [Chlamydiales bacterium]